MSEIHVLDSNTVNKIAAGEVIERPTSVVKELMENSIDAGATAITVEIKEGGVGLIRICDNGSGIEHSQLKNAFVSHATSKIKDSDDLFHIGSLGFRGEALSSVAAVARVQLITRTNDEAIGSLYEIEGGEETRYEQIGAPLGTTLIVRDLFYKTPVRRKFLKSAATEGSYVSQTVERIALSHPEVSVRLIVNGQNRLFTKGNSSVKDLIYAVYGREIASNLLPVEYDAFGIRIRGFIGKPVITRGNRDMENYFINGRFIKNKVLTKAVEDAYKSYLMQHKFPFTVLYIQMDPELLDVNVHPTKMELRISDELHAYEALYGAVLDALKGKEYIPQTTFRAAQTASDTDRRSDALVNAQNKEAFNEPFETVRKSMESTAPKNVVPWKLPEPESMREPENLSETAPVTKKDEETTYSAPMTVCSVREETPEPVKQENILDALIEHKVLSEEARIRFQLIGQVFLTYWIFEYQGKMFIMDQHAAHEKVLFERNMKNFREKTVYSQQLCPQRIVTLTNRQIDCLETILPALNDMGYEINPFGGNEYAVAAIPASLPDIDVFEFLTQLLDGLASDDVSSLAVNDMLYDRIATMSCKAAVKGNNRLSFAEANALLDELLHLDNPYMCPHGRPTVVSITKDEIEKMFKRIV